MKNFLLNPTKEFALSEEQRAVAEIATYRYADIVAETEATIQYNTIVSMYANTEREACELLEIDPDSEEAAFACDKLESRVQEFCDKLNEFTLYGRFSAEWEEGLYINYTLENVVSELALNNPALAKRIREFCENNLRHIQSYDGFFWYGGDYDYAVSGACWVYGGDTVVVSNQTALCKRFSFLQIWETNRGGSMTGIDLEKLPADLSVELWQQFEETICALENYPVVDEEELSEHESEVEREAFESYNARALKETLVSVVRGRMNRTVCTEEQTRLLENWLDKEPLESLDDEELWRIWLEVSDATSQYAVFESGESVYIDWKRVQDKLTVCFRSASSFQIVAEVNEERVAYQFGQFDTETPLFDSPT